MEDRELSRASKRNLENSSATESPSCVPLSSEREPITCVDRLANAWESLEGSERLGRAALEQSIRTLKQLQVMGVLPHQEYLDAQLACRRTCLGGELYASCVVSLEPEPSVHHRTVLLVEGDEKVFDILKIHLLEEMALEPYGCLFGDSLYEEIRGKSSFAVVEVKKLAEGNAVPILLTFHTKEEAQPKIERKVVEDLVQELMTKLKFSNMTQFASFHESHDLHLIPELARSFSSIISLFPPTATEQNSFHRDCHNLERDVSNCLAVVAMQDFLSQIPPWANKKDLSACKNAGLT